MQLFFYADVPNFYIYVEHIGMIEKSFVLHCAYYVGQYIFLSIYREVSELRQRIINLLVNVSVLYSEGIRSKEE